MPFQDTPDGETKNYEGIRFLLSEHAKTLADLALDNHGHYFEHSDKDLENATLIFMHFFMAKMWEYQQKQTLTEEQILMLAEQAGKSLRQTILLFTGLDMHEVVKR